MSTKPDNVPAKPRVRPIIQCHGFIPPNTGLAIFALGVRRPTKINLDNAVRMMQSYIDARSFSSIDEGFNALINQYGNMEIVFRERNLPASISRLYSTATKDTTFLPGHLPILKSWLGPAADVILTQNPTSWWQVFNILETSKGKIAATFGFSCNYLDWCEARIGAPLEATISVPAPIAGSNTITPEHLRHAVERMNQFLEGTTAANTDTTDTGYIPIFDTFTQLIYDEEDTLHDERNP